MDAVVQNQGKAAAALIPSLCRVLKPKKVEPERTDQGRDEGLQRQRRTASIYLPDPHANIYSANNKKAENQFLQETFT